MINKVNQIGINLLIILFLLFILMSKKAAGQSADLTVSVEFMMTTMQIINHNFKSSDKDDKCQVLQKPIGDECTDQSSYGNKKLLSFSLKTINVGTGDFSLGKTPKKGVSSGYYQWSACHKHHHFIGFVEYGLYDLCNNIRAGHKLGGAFYDCADPSDTKCEATHSGFPRQDCIGTFQLPFSDTDQGLHAGCADIYAAYISNSSIPGVGGIPCQFLDITGIPDGRYILKAHVNFRDDLIASHSNLQEANFSNNTGYVLLEIQGNTVSIFHGTLNIHDRVISNLDLLPSFIQQTIKNSLQWVVNKNTIEVSGSNTFDDNIQREFVAGNKITLLPGTTIAPQPGGKWMGRIEPCLVSATLKTSNPYNDSSVAIINNAQPTEERNIEVLDNLIDRYFSVVPNPSENGQYTLTMPDIKDNPTLLVYDMLGRVVFRQEKFNSNKICIDISTQLKGAYFINIIQGEKIFTDIVIFQ